jgi:hypothetical protein
LELFFFSDSLQEKNNKNALRQKAYFISFVFSKIKHLKAFVH